MACGHRNVSSMHILLILVVYMLMDMHYNVFFFIITIQFLFSLWHLQTSVVFNYINSLVISLLVSIVY